MFLTSIPWRHFFHQNSDFRHTWQFSDKNLCSFPIEIFPEQKKTSGAFVARPLIPVCRVRLLCYCIWLQNPFLISAAVVHIVPAGVLRFVLAGISAGVLSLVLIRISAGILGAVSAGIVHVVPAAVLGTVLSGIHGIGSVAVFAVFHITVMISHNAYLLFAHTNLLQD